MSSMVDLQTLLPQFVLDSMPQWYRDVPRGYIADSGDFLVAATFPGYIKHPEYYLWFRSFQILQGAFQFPVYALGAYYLYKGKSLEV
jgi:hypothetical protein